MHFKSIGTNRIYNLCVIILSRNYPSYTYIFNRAAGDMLSYVNSSHNVYEDVCKSASNISI